MEAKEIPMEGQTRPEAHPGWHEEAVVYEMKHGATLSFMRRVSIGAMVAGALVALAAQLLFIAFGSFLKIGASSVVTLADFSNSRTSIGIWVAVSAVIATFIGAYVAARLAGTTRARNGMWHGLATWGLVIVAGMVLALFDFSGVLGFGVNASQLITRYVPGTIGALTAADLTTATDIASSMSGWFLAGALGSLITAIFGGLFGGMSLSRRAEEEMVEEEVEERYHRAA